MSIHLDIGNCGRSGIYIIGGTNAAGITITAKMRPLAIKTLDSEEEETRYLVHPHFRTAVLEAMEARMLKWGWTRYSKAWRTHERPCVMTDDVRAAMRDWLDAQDWNIFFSGRDGKK